MVKGYLLFGLGRVLRRRNREARGKESLALAEGSCQMALQGLSKPLALSAGLSLRARHLPVRAVGTLTAVQCYQ